MTARTIDLIQTAGDHATRPTATTVPAGALYSCTDHDLVYRSDGTTWSTWATVGAGGATTLNGLTDVDTTGLTTGDVLTYDGAQWEPAAPTGGGTTDPDDGETLGGGDDYNFTATSSSLPSGWAYLNSTANLTYQEMAGKGTLMYAGGAFSYVRGIYKTLPGGFTQATFRFSGMTFNTGSDDLIFFIQDSTSTKVIDLAFRSSGTVVLHRFNSPTSFSAQTTINWPAGFISGYVRIVKNSSSSWDFQYGTARGAFVTLFNFDVSSFTSAIDRIGFGFVNEAGNKQVLSVDYVKFG